MYERQLEVMCDRVRNYAVQGYRDLKMGTRLGRQWGIHHQWPEGRAAGKLLEQCGSSVYLCKGVYMNSSDGDVTVVPVNKRTERAALSVGWVEVEALSMENV